MGKGKIEPLEGWEKPRPLRGGGREAGTEGSSGRRLLSTSARDPTVNPARGEGSVTYPLSLRGLLPRHNRLITPDYVPVFRRVRVRSWPCQDPSLSFSLSTSLSLLLSLPLSFFLSYTYIHAYTHIHTRSLFFRSLPRPRRDPGT